MSKLLDNNGVLYLWGKITALIAGKVNAVDGKGLSANDYSTAEKNKLAGVQAGATQDGYMVGTVTLPSSDWASFTPANTPSTYRYLAQTITVAGMALSTGKVVVELEFAGGSAAVYDRLTMVEAVGEGIRFVVSYMLGQTQPTLDNVTVRYRYQRQQASAAACAISKAERVSPDMATTDAAGLMSASDKAKLNGIAEGANAYTHPAYTARAAGLAKLTVDATGHVSGATAVTKADITGLGIPAQDTTYAAATASVAGLMAAADKQKLDAFGAASTYALKTDVTSMYRHRGSVAAVASLPSAGNTAGDVWNVTASGMNYVWTGSAWDALGEVFTMQTITNAEIDAICV